MSRVQKISGQALNPALFTDFIGSYHDQDQAGTQMKTFASPTWMKAKIEDSIK